MVTSLKADIGSCIPGQVFLFCEEPIQLCITPGWLAERLLYHP